MLRYYIILGTTKKQLINVHLMRNVVGGGGGGGGGKFLRFAPLSGQNEGERHRKINWRASETVLGVDNAKSGICYIYVCMYGWYVSSLNARA